MFDFDAPELAARKLAPEELAVEELAVEELAVGQTAEALGRGADQQLRLQCRQLILAAHWADLYPGAGVVQDETGSGRLVGERTIYPGGPGTPEVAEFAPAELGPVLAISIGQARSLLADALDLRHRFPTIWRLIGRGIVAGWAVRQIARTCRDLTADQAAAVDRILAAHLAGIGRHRLETLLDAAVLRVDSVRQAELAERARRARFVRLTRSNEYGTKGVYSRMDTPDAIRLDAMINRIAEILSAAPEPIPGVPDRDPHSHDEWRAIAHGLLSNPLLAAQLLIQHEQPDLFDTVTDRQQPPLRFDPERDDVQPDHYPTNQAEPVPFDSRTEPPAEVDPPDPAQEGDHDCADSLPDHSTSNPSSAATFLRDRPDLGGEDPADEDPAGAADHDRSDPFLRRQYQRELVRQILRHLDPRRLMPQTRAA